MRYLPFVEEIPFKGWDGVYLSNGLIDAVCVPEIGGRLMQFSLGPNEFLFMNPDLLGKRFTFEEHAGDGELVNWKNYGGAKTWPAPQGWDGEGQWPGPPDPVLDSGQYQFETSQADTCASVSMTSPPDERSGLRIRRNISLGRGSSRLQFDLSFENISNRAIRWSIWDVAQMACATFDGQLNDDCWLYIPTDPNRERPYEIMFGDDNPISISWIRQALCWRCSIEASSARSACTAPLAGSPSPIGQHGFRAMHAVPVPARCRISRQRRNGGMLDRIARRAVADTYTLARIYSRGGSPQSAATRCTQLQIAMRRIVTWSAAYCPAPIVAVADVGCAHQPLSIDLSEGWARTRGVFGCFLAGHAELVFLDSSDTILSRIDLGPVSPLSVLNVDTLVRVNDGTARISLNILDVDGTAAGTLSSVVLAASV